MFWFLFYLLYLPALLVMPVKVVGKKNYNKKCNYIIVCNHRSALDPVIIDYKLNKRIRFIAKKELWKGKEKSFFYDNILGCVPIDRENGLNLSTTKKVFDILKTNQNIGIFPEGTRKDTDEDIQVKDGACLFAIKSKKPILPCFIINKQKPFKSNVLIVGEPFELDEFYDKKLDKESLSQAGNILANKINCLKAEYLTELEKKHNKKIKKNTNKVTSLDNKQN